MAKRQGVIRFAAIAALCIAVAACGVRNTHHVRKGIDPRYQDKDVAFRTTYYFRVFDFCADQARLNGAPKDKQKYKGIPRLDSLFRFRMTGKSDTMFNKVRFESGTLKSWEIDPFGANVIYDENTGRFRFQSQEEGALEARQKGAYKEYERLLGDYQELVGERNKHFKQPSNNTEIKPPIPDPVLTTLAAAISAKLREATGLPVSTTPNPPAREAAPVAAIDCAGDIKERRGFQILGPEGWRTFDPDERLIMAMRSSNEPLTGALKQLSQRMLTAHDAGKADLMPLVESRLQTSEALRRLDLRATTPPDSGDTLKKFTDLLAKTVKGE